MFKILVITDDKQSSINQCDSLVRELKRSKKKINVKYMKVTGRFIKYSPSIFIYYLLKLESLLFRKKFELDLDLIISCGRISAPYNLIFKKVNICTNCHILNPYIFNRKFNKIIIPEYDLKKFSNKENIITTYGSLVNLDKLKPKKNDLHKIKELVDNKLKNILVLVGGNGKSSVITYSDLEKVLIKLNKNKIRKQIIFCFSRRTSKELQNKIIENKNGNSLVFPNNDFNPYWELLYISDYNFVTGDSISMTSDSLSSGKPTYVIPIAKVKNKIKVFQEGLIKKKVTRIFDGRLENWKYSKFNESHKVGVILRNYLKL